MIIMTITRGAGRVLHTLAASGGSSGPACGRKASPAVIPSAQGAQAAVKLWSVRQA
jgi:hypothetical protein